MAQCAVIGIPSERWGEQVHAIAVPKPGAQAAPEELMEFCKTLIAGYKCPRSVHIHAEPLPLSSVNKIDKASLRAPFWKDRGRQVN